MKEVEELGDWSYRCGWRNPEWWAWSLGLACCAASEGKDGPAIWYGPSKELQGLEIER